ncbi:MAG TPA: hypothetical protein VJL35_14805 [Gemmatimonadaceae bacterium]|nr:hypothetical protein [Gemmatimonadaceae bacterium]
MADQGKKPEPPKQRSPEHPGVSLEEAVERAGDFYKYESFNYAPADVAKRHFGYGPKSSSGMRLIAALKHYGLFEEDGSGHERRLRLTPLARNILLDRREDPTEREDALRTAALNPAIYRTLWKYWNGNLPSDPNMEFELIRKFKFNPDSVRPFIKDFKATVTFAKLAQSDSLLPVSEETAGEQERRPHTVTPPPSAPPTNKPQGGSMPQVQTADTVQMAPLDVTIPLGGGIRAILRMPESLTKSQFNYLVTMLKVNLGTMMPILTGNPESTTEADNAEETQADWPEA